MKEFFETFISNTQILGWAIAFVVFLIVEGVTLNALVSIWFAAAALFAMFAAMAGLGFVWQLAIFVVSSVVLLIATKTLVKQMHKNKQDPNMDYDIGKTAVVIETVCNETSSGRVKLDGVDWAARSEDGRNICEGTTVTVKKVDGAKLIVAASDK
ncbi:MAG: NfeD family protein [Oscillospiraceae bacterium]